MSGSRRLSQAISEGDGISLIVRVADASAAFAAEAEGAEGLAVTGRIAGLREQTGLPILFQAEASLEGARLAGADACLLVIERVEDVERLVELHDEAHRLGLELVVDVHDEEELELALERIDPEIFLLSPRGAEDGEEAIERVLDLLPDVPAGKLAIADVPATSRAEVVALERAGVDAVLVNAANVAELVGGVAPEV